MQNGFTKGILIGGIIGASVSMMSDSGMIMGRTRRKLMRRGRQMVGDFLGILR